jgi:hypothetical protein
MASFPVENLLIQQHKLQQLKLAKWQMQKDLDYGDRVLHQVQKGDGVAPIKVTSPLPTTPEKEGFSPTSAAVDAQTRKLLHWTGDVVGHLSDHDHLDHRHQIHHNHEQGEHVRNNRDVHGATGTEAAALPATVRGSPSLVAALRRRARGHNALGTNHPEDTKGNEDATINVDGAPVSRQPLTTSDQVRSTSPSRRRKAKLVPPTTTATAAENAAPSPTTRGRAVGNDLEIIINFPLAGRPALNRSTASSDARQHSTSNGGTSVRLGGATSEPGARIATLGPVRTHSLLHEFLSVAQSRPNNAFASDDGAKFDQGEFLLSFHISSSFFLFFFLPSSLSAGVFTATLATINITSSIKHFHLCLCWFFGYFQVPLITATCCTAPCLSTSAVICQTKTC